MIIDVGEAALAVALLLPATAMVILIGAVAVGHPPTERRVHQLVAASMGTALLATLAVLWTALTAGPVTVDFGTPIALRGYHFALVFRADVQGALYLTLDLLLCGLIGAFSERYLHREPGYHRFFVLLLAFVVGVAVIATASGLDLLFAGWEIVGLASALLIAFFHERPGPVENGLYAYGMYRIADIGLLLGVVSLHHAAGSADLGDLHLLAGWDATTVAGLIVFGAMAKGGIFPFTPWLPRAMEGPTPSSAIFYGALSIHASPFLLLRIQPLIAETPWVAAAVVGLGILTLVHATMVGNAQNDIKSSLGYASAAQVGLIWVWIGFGWTTLAMVHLVGHALFRTWQLLRSPSLFLERRALAYALHRAPAETGWVWARIVPLPLRRSLFRLALERWHLEAAWTHLFQAAGTVLRLIDRTDRAWAAVFHEDFREPEHVLDVEPMEARR